MKSIRIGMVGSGFIARIHCRAYQMVCGYEVVLAGICSLDEAGARQLMEAYGIPKLYSSLDEMLADPSLEIIDICTPPFLHLPMARQVLAAGKHVIIEKPLTGYFGDGQSDEVGTRVSRQEMLRDVIRQMDEFRGFLQTCDKQLFYAENFIYAPSVVKSKEMLEKTKSKILLLKAEESHSGSHAYHAAYWKYTGGGSLIRQGCHPLSAVLYLKMIENRARGEAFKVASVLGDMGNTIARLPEAELKYIEARPKDVEDCANVIVTFGDGTKANIVACDMVVGGTKNLVEVYTPSSVHMCNIAPNDAMKVYHPAAEAAQGLYLTEKVETNAGWQDVFLEEMLMRGYVGELQDFVECAATGRQPQSGFELGYESIKLIYAAYLSAEQGKRIEL